ncbi:MAG: hypothetical protein DI598_10120 [Pseudopedobacter saltans]|uniref:Uncharacterized protein n=1 Tax=Pseudopedobacter saltans TaxID=151895 RepID=A0A2W5F389_9SPHI|nr:MAG: hypothetical protein DI598_10120 [Pseudopedobacter saltans]
MAKQFRQILNTIDEGHYIEVLENFLSTNGADLNEDTKDEIRKDPDRFVLFGDTEDGLEVTLKNPLQFPRH